MCVCVCYRMCVSLGKYIFLCSPKPPLNECASVNDGFSTHIHVGEKDRYSKPPSSSLIGYDSCSRPLPPPTTDEATNFFILLREFVK